MNMEARVVLWRGARTFHLRETDMTSPNLSVVFKLNPSTIYLLTQGGDVLMPGPSGFFGVPMGERYEVCGEEAPTTSAESSSAAAGFSFPRPMAAQALPPVPPRPRPPTTFSRSIYIGRVEGRNVLLEQKMILILTDQEAQSTDTVCDRIKREMRTDQEIRLCDAQGKELVVPADSARVWRCTTRKVVVLLERDFIQLQGAKRRRSSSNGAEGDAEELAQAADALPAVADNLNQLQGLMRPSMAVVAVVDAMRVALRCLICRDSMRDPVVDPACRSLIGCSACVQQWTDGSPRCPKCRDPSFRANLMRLNGMEEVLEILRATD